MTIEQYRKRWMRRHSRYEKQAYKILIQNFRDIANSIPFGFLNEDNYETIIESNVKNESFINAYYQIYDTIGKQEGERVGKMINREIKEWTISSFLSAFERNLFSWILTNGGQRISTVRSTFINYINEYIAFGLNDGRTISEITTELQELINRRNFYRWQSLRIARTETTTASNYAATVSADVSGVQTQKMWISAQDARTRREPVNHFNMNGVRVDIDQNFNVSNEEMEYPGDPNASAANVVNCRCTVAVVPKRDANGRIIRTDIIM